MSQGGHGTGLPGLLARGQHHLQKEALNKLPYFGTPAVKHLTVRILNDTTSSIHTTTACRGRTGTAPLNLNLDTRCRFAVSCKPRPNHHRCFF
jgi:hypothetical protein